MSNIVQSTHRHQCLRKYDSKQMFRELRQKRGIEKLLQIGKTTISTVKMASSQLVSVDAAVSVPFRLENQCYNEKLLVPKSANNLIRGKPFFKKHNISKYALRTICYHFLR